MRTFRRILLGIGAFVALAYAAACVYAYWPGEPEVPAPQLARPGDRFVAVDGLTLRYREYGFREEAGRPELVLIHGFANSLQSWRLLAPRLAECCAVIALDLPGYGLSSKPADLDYRNEPQARRVVAAVHALGFERPVYVGHSLGGAIALHAVLLDSSASGLVLMNPGILTTGVPKIAQLTVPPIPRLAAKQFGSRGFRERFLKLSYVNPAIVTPQVVDDVMLAARSEGYLAGTTSLMKQYVEGEETPLLARVRVPTLIMWGDRDRNKLRSEADDLQRAIPGSRLVRFANAGHYVHEEAAEGVARKLGTWKLGTLPHFHRPLAAGDSANRDRWK
jgi:pimeloyl-ACP methyl ester carboxylesterase